MLRKFQGIAWLAFCLFSVATKGQTLREFEYIDAKGRTQMAGLVSLNHLKAEPYSKWFQKGYLEYFVEDKKAKKLGKYLKDMDIQVFMGTWCGDSKREIPRLVRVLEVARIDPARVNYICVYSEPERRNISPTMEQKGRNIHHVPTIILFKDGKEVGRVIESPLSSLEDDLLDIVSGEVYPTHYPAAEAMIGLVNKPMPAFSDSLGWAKIVSKIDSLNPRSPSELNALARMYKNQNQFDQEAHTLKLNSLLFPGFLATKEKLAIALKNAGNKAEARLVDEELLKEAEELAKKAKERLSQE
jgi:thiol-disulfide isomerase/thioredoxin